jgi:hypothetical protein
MKRIFRKMIVTLVRSPKKLFLIDGVGALLTAILLLTIRTQYQQDFGMPANVLSFLILMAGVFCSYSFGCFLLVRKQWQSFLKFIAIANFLYACSTCFLIFYLNQTITTLGVIYFSLEIGVILALVIIELKVLQESKEQTLQSKTEKYEHFKP